MVFHRAVDARLQNDKLNASCGQVLNMMAKEDGNSHRNKLQNVNYSQDK
jgi:hypothetical protein